MTVETFQYNTPESVGPVGLQALREWAIAASDASQLVAPLVDTAFIPESYRPKVDPRATFEEKAAARQVAVATATAAVLHGISLGLDPLTALQTIYVIKGRIALYSKMKVALVQGRGHEIWTEDLTDSRAVVCGRRAGSQTIERITITMEQARKAGWTSSDTYTKTPQDMLWARAAGRVADRIGADILGGVASVEDIEDDDAKAPAPQDGTRSVQRATRRPEVTGAVRGAMVREARTSVALDRDQTHAIGDPEPAARTRPPLPGETDADTYKTTIDPDTALPVMLDESQWRKINARFVALGIVGTGQKENRLKIISELIGWPITQGSEMTADQGQMVLDNLAGVDGQAICTDILRGSLAIGDDNGEDLEEVADDDMTGDEVIGEEIFGSQS